jgi:hypothetical protein
MKLYAVYQGYTILSICDSLEFAKQTCINIDGTSVEEFEPNAYYSDGLFSIDKHGRSVELKTVFTDKDYNVL